MRGHAPRTAQTAVARERMPAGAPRYCRSSFGHSQWGASAGGGVDCSRRGEIDTMQTILWRKPRSRWRSVIFVAIVATVLSGCLTMRRGSTQTVQVDSSPQGATVVVQPGGTTFETPSRILLPRRYSQSLRFEMEGFQPETVVVERKASSGLWRNVIWIHPIGWIIGLVVDLSTGSGYDLRPDAVSVNLKPAVPKVSSPPPSS